MSVTAGVPRQTESVAVSRGGSRDEDVLDEGAFATLYAEHRAALYRYILARTGDRDRAEDLVQDVFAKAFASRSRYDRTRPFWPWLASIAARECIDAHRRRTYAESRLAQFARSRREEPIDLTSSAVLRAVEERRLANAVANLPARQRVALQLVAMDEWSYADVAERLGYSVSMVKALVVRARRKLRETGAGALGAVTGLLRPWRTRSQHAGARFHAAFATVPRIGGLAAAWSSGGPATVIAVIVAAAMVSPQGAGPAPRLEAPSRVLAPSDGSGRPASAQEAVAPPAGGGAVGRTGPAARPWAGVEQTANESIGAVASPGEARHDPESVQVSAFGTSPHYEQDHTIVLAGSLGFITPDARTVGVSVPFLVSEDGGASWQSRRALGLASVSRLLFPPDYPRDPRLFAVTTKGLQVSANGGESFETLVPMADITDAAVSPGFDTGDPTILLLAGARLWAYNDGTGVVEPLDTGAALARHQVLGVAYAGGAVGRREVVVGSANIDRVLGAAAGYVSRCTMRRMLDGGTVPLACESARIPSLPAMTLPLRVPAAGSSVIYVPFEVQPYVSTDGGRSFRPARRFWAEGDEHYRLYDLVAVPSPTGQSAIMAQESWRWQNNTRVSGAPLARTDDAGRTWHPIPVDVPKFDWGATRVTVTPTGRIVVAAWSGGIACSEDGGRSWARLCPTPEV